MQDFEDWVHQAEAMFESSSEYPLIDDQNIDMFSSVYDCWTSDVAGERWSTFLHERLIASECISVRFVVLNFLYRVAHFYVDDQEWSVKVYVDDQEWSVKDRREILARRLAGAVQFRDPAALENPKAVR